MNEENENGLIKKKVGGMKLPNGFAMGPLYFSKDGKTANNLFMQPAIIPFDFGITNSFNRLNKENLPTDEFQTEFNSLVNNLVAETLIYFQNRIKPIIKKGAGNFNDMDDSLKEYKKVGIEIENMCEFPFLKDLSNVRGRKQHSARRYDTDYIINGVSYDTVEKLRELTNKVKKEIHDFNEKLSTTHKDYEIKISQTENTTSVEFSAINHAFDLTRGAKVFPLKQKPPK